MLIDFTDPDDLAAWLRVAPDRHGPQLVALAKLRPQYREAARQAIATVKAERRDGAAKVGDFLT